MVYLFHCIPSYIYTVQPCFLQTLFSIWSSFKLLGDNGKWKSFLLHIRVRRIKDVKL